MADGGAGYVDIGLALGAMAASGVATEMKIDEGIGDYGRAIEDLNAQILETDDERKRRIAETQAIGAASLSEKAAAGAFEHRKALTNANMIASAAENRIGASGVRAKGSPLMAAQNATDLAYATADRAGESNTNQMKIGGLQLKSNLSGIQAQSTLLTNSLQRKVTEASFKKKELKENKAGMVAQAVLGGAPALASSFYSAAKVYDW